jgi:hypothetical protein
MPSIVFSKHVDREQFNVTCRDAVTGGACLSDLDRVAPEPLATAKSIPDAEDVQSAESSSRAQAPGRHRTPGLPEGHYRAFNAINDWLELHPYLIGRFTFVQIASPRRHRRISRVCGARRHQGAGDQRKVSGS